MFYWLCFHLTILGLTVAHQVWHVKYPEGRTGIYLAPLFVLMCASACYAPLRWAKPAMRCSSLMS